MNKRLYCTDAIDTWHSVAALNEFKREVRGRCGHDFAPKTPPVTARPRESAMCSGCLGAEERAALFTRPPTPPVGRANSITATQVTPLPPAVIVGQRGAFGGHKNIVGDQ
jgi:hypothetical protein